MRIDDWFVTTSSLSAAAGPDVEMVEFDGAVLDRKSAQMIAESIAHLVWTASPDGATRYFRSYRETAELATLLATLHANAPIGFGFVDPELRMLGPNAALAAVTIACADQ